MKNFVLCLIKRHAESETDISFERITPPFQQTYHTFVCFDWPINGGDQTSWWVSHFHRKSWENNADDSSISPSFLVTFRLDYEADFLSLSPSSEQIFRYQVFGFTSSPTQHLHSSFRSYTLHWPVKCLRVEYHRESPSANTNRARSVTQRHILVEFVDSRDVCTFLPLSSAIKGQAAVGTISFSYSACRERNIWKPVSSGISMAGRNLKEHRTVLL